MGDDYTVNKYLGTDDKHSLPLDRILVITSKGDVSEEKTNDLRRRLEQRLASKVKDFEEIE